MTSHPPISPTNIKLHYEYLLLRKDGTILPLVAINDLPSMITVLPPLNIMNGMTLLQEIPPFPLPYCPKGLETALPSAATQFTNRSAPEILKSNPETTPQNPNGLVQHQDQALTPGPLPPYSQLPSPAASVADRIRDAVHPRILFPEIFSPPPTGTHTSASLSPPKNGPFCLRPHSQHEGPTPIPTQPIIPSPPITKPCPTCTPSDTYLCGSRHDIRPTEKTSQLFTHCINEDSSDGETTGGEDPSDEASYTSIGEDGDSFPIGGNDEAKSESVMRHEAKNSKTLKSTELCAYFHRGIGCRRGKDCSYIHESTEKDKDGSTSLSGQTLGPGLGGTKYTSSGKSDTHASTASSRKLEGKWRRTEKGKDKEVVADGDDNEAISDRKCPMTLQISPKITCPTPGRTLSPTDPAKHIKTHCTFFLRFGECDYWPACKFSHEQPEVVSRWRGSKLPSSPKRTPTNNCGGGQDGDEEATNKKGRSGKPLGRDVKRLTTVFERKRNSSFYSIGSSGPSSSCEGDGGDSDTESRTVERKNVREGQLISLIDWL